MTESQIPLIISTPDECQLKGTTITMNITNASTQRVGYQMQVAAINKKICFIQTKEKYGSLKPQEVKEFSVFVTEVPCILPLLLRVILTEEDNVNNLVNLLKNADPSEIIKQRYILNVDWSTTSTESAELTSLKDCKLYTDAIYLRSNVMLHTDSKPIEEKNEKLFEELKIEAINLREENAMLKKEIMKYKQAMEIIIDTAVSVQSSDKNNVEVIERMLPTSSTTTALTEHDTSADLYTGLVYGLEHKSELIAVITVINPTSKQIYFYAERTPFLSCDLSQNHGILKPQERFEIIVNIKKVPVEINFFIKWIKVGANDDFVVDLWETAYDIKQHEIKWTLLELPDMSFAKYISSPLKEKEKAFTKIIEENKLKLKENLMIRIESAHEKEDEKGNCEKKNADNFTKKVSVVIDEITATTARTTTTTKLIKHDDAPLFVKDKLGVSSPDDLTHNDKFKIKK